MSRTSMLLTLPAVFAIISIGAASSKLMIQPTRSLSDAELGVLAGGGANGVCEQISGCDSAGTCKFSGDPGCQNAGHIGNACQDPATFTRGALPEFCNRNTSEPAKCYASPFDSKDELECQLTGDCKCAALPSGTLYCKEFPDGGWSKTDCVQQGSVLQGKCRGTVHEDSSCP